MAIPLGTTQRLSLIELAETLDPVLQNLWQTIFTGAWNPEEFWAQRFCATYSSDQQITQFPYSDQFFEYFYSADLKEEARFRQVSAKFQSVKVLKIQPKGIEIHETEMANQAIIGTVLQSQISEMAKTWQRFLQDRVINSLLAGDTDPYYITAYDGEQFFSTTHKIGITQQAWGNLFPYALTADNYALVIDNFRAIPLGDPTTNNLYMPTGGAKFVLVIAPELEKLANLIFTNNYLYQALTTGVNATSDNPYKEGTFAKYAPEIIVEPNLRGSDSWFVLMVPNNVSKQWVNVIQQTGTSRLLIASTSPQSESVLRHGYLRWEARSYEETYPTVPFLQTKCTG